MGHQVHHWVSPEHHALRLRFIFAISGSSCLFFFIRFVTNLRIGRRTQVSKQCIDGPLSILPDALNYVGFAQLLVQELGSGVERRS